MPVSRAREFTGHMLLTCFLYTQERLTLFSKVEKLLPKFTSFMERRKIEVCYGLYPDNPDFQQTKKSLQIAV